MAEQDQNPVQDNGDEVDKYGFKNSTSQLMTKKEVDALRRRETKWRHLLEKWNKRHQLSSSDKDLVKRRCRKGIPDSMRALVWPKLLDAHSDDGTFDSCVSLDVERVLDEHKRGEVKKFLDIIDRDLHRTFPDHIHFDQRGGHGQNDLGDVLKAYVVFNPEVGYLQGMGMIVASFLMYMDPTTVFYCFSSLLDNEKYALGMYDPGLIELQVVGFTLHFLLERKFPVIHQKLHENMIDPMLYMADWFLCAYAKTMPFGTVVRLWDMFFWEGRKVLFRAALTIFHLNRSELEKANDFQDIMDVLKSLDESKLQPDVFLPAFFKVKVKHHQISQAREQAIEHFKKDRGPYKPPIKRGDALIKDLTPTPPATPTAVAENNSKTTPVILVADDAHSDSTDSDLAAISAGGETWV